VNAPHSEETHSLDAPGGPSIQPSDDDPILTDEELAMVQAAVKGRPHHDQAPHRAEPVHRAESVLGAQSAPYPEPIEATGGRVRQAWDQIQMAFPRLMGQPAYGRPRSLFAPGERPFDPDDLPLEAERSADDRRAAEILATSAGSSRERNEGGGRGWRSVTRLLRLGD
jgi:hypothetical protein